MIKCWKILLAMLLAIQGTAWAESEMEVVRNNLKRIIPESMEIKSIEQTAMEGVYQVAAGNEYLFVHSRGDFVMIGEVYDAVRRISLTQERKDKEKVIAMKELAAISESEMIIMGDPQGERYVTVFTDTDCGWCQKFHQDIPALQAGGLKVRYLMWPRAGINSESYDEAVSVWCADDQGAAMTIAKNRQQVEPKTCDNPVKEQYALGFRLGVQGTPFIMLDNGEVLGGYVEPDRLLSAAKLK